MIGKTVGKYKILDRLGRGGMGTVYRAIDETLDREVAIKVLNADFDETDVLKRFRAEAVTLARLSHPGIATIFELYRQDDDLLMVMEFVRGETVHALSERLGPLAVPQAAHVCLQVLDALGHAHRAGIVHRDLKPANLMISESGGVKVMDFGIARMLGTEHFTQGGYMMGTPAYMAPEQVLGREVDGRSDLYSVGVVFYRLLAGELPFKADTSIGMVQKQISEAPTPIATFCPDLPAWCVALIDRALQKSPTDRFQSAEEFRAALAAGVKPEGLGELPTMATPAPPGIPISSLQREPTTRRVTRQVEAPPMDTGRTTERTTTTVVLGRTHLMTLSALLAVLVAGIAVLGFLALRRSNSTPPSQTAGAGAPGSEAKPDPTVAATPPPAAVPTPPAAPPAGGASTPSTSPKPADPVPPLVTAPGGSPTRPVPAAKGPVAEVAPVPGGPARGVDPALKGRGDAAARGGRDVPRGVANDPASPAPRVIPPESPQPVLVSNIRLALQDAGRGPAREREGVLRLGDGQFQVFDRNRAPLVTIPYAALQSAYISRGPQPKWRLPDGTPVVGRVDVAGIGLFNKGDRNWIVVIANNNPPVFLRLPDGNVRTVIAEFHARSGVPVQRFVGEP